MAKKKSKVYVVWKGRKLGIYQTWDECKAQTDGFPGARFKSFPTDSEARQAFASGSPKGSKKPSSTSGKKQSGTANTAFHDISQNAFSIFCDGGCDPNPGPSGTGMAVYKGEESYQHWCGHHDPQGTNNRAELYGFFESLRYAQSLIAQGLVTAERKAVIYCDSQYTINCITKWARSWRKNGWMTKKQTPVLNPDIIEPAYDLFVELTNCIEIKKVKAHIGIPGNEMADQLAGIARQRKMSDWTLTFENK